MMAGNLLKQFYNIVDTLIVGRVLGSDALFSIYQGKGEKEGLRMAVLHAGVLILGVTLVLNVAVYLGMDGILAFLKVPDW